MNRIFPKIRLCTLIVFFIISVFGVYLLGSKLTSYELPLFACPVNREGGIDGACYTLSHLNDFISDNISSENWFKLVEFFGITFLSIFLLGRAMCGFLCPFGFIQDSLYRLKNLFRVDAFRFSEKRMPQVRLFKWSYLAIFFLLCLFGFSFCKICPVIAFTPAFGGAMVKISFSALFAVSVIVGAFFKKRIWCNICPVGYFVGLFYRFSLFRLNKSCKACTECGACYEACPMEIKSIYTERKKTDITTVDCLLCSECVKACPEDNALSLSVAGRKIYTASRNDYFHHHTKNL